VKVKPLGMAEEKEGSWMVLMMELWCVIVSSRKWKGGKADKDARVFMPLAVPPPVTCHSLLPRISEMR